MTSSFQRKVKSKLPDIPGTYPSLYTSHLLVSSGVPDLDTLLGGGLAVGTVLVISEDYSGNFSRLMLKYFLAEGVVHQHSLLVTDSSPDAKIITNNLPSFELNKSQENPSQVESESDEKMKIAWRYQGQNTTKESSNNINANASAHTFNLLKTVSNEVIEKCDKKVCEVDASNEDGSWRNSAYARAIKDLESKVKDGGFVIDPTGAAQHKNILRIGFQSLGLSLWGDLTQREKHLPKFLYCLRSVLRSCFGVAVVTIPSSILSLEHFRDSVLLLSDYCVSLESFEGDEKVNEVYKDYHGLLNIQKIQSLGNLGPPNQLIQDPSQLVFKSKRTKFVIEKFHLPPDLSETVSRDNKDKTMKKSDIDF